MSHASEPWWVRPPDLGGATAPRLLDFSKNPAVSLLLQHAIQSRLRRAVVSGKRAPLVMKRIEAIIKPFKFEEVRAALLEIGVQGLTVTDVEGIGRQRGHREIYRGSEYTADMLPKLKLEILVSDAQAARVVEVLSETARTGKIGDGKIFVIPVEELVRVRTKEKGETAL